MQRHRSLGALALAAVALSASACGSDDAPATRPVLPTVATVEVAPNTVELTVGASRPLVATARDSRGVVLTGRSTEWQSDAESVVAISPEGRLLARAVGAAQIVARVGGAEGRARVTVRSATSPAPILTALRPARIVEGWGANFTLTLTGEGFTVATRVWWGDLILETTFLSERELQVTVTPSMIARAAQVAVRAVTPEPGGGRSAPLPFTIAPIPVAFVEVTSPTGGPWTWAGDALPLVAQALSADRVPLTGRAVRWQSSNSTIATVDSTGTVRGVSPGQATISASVDQVMATTTVTVFPAPTEDLVYAVRQGARSSLFLLSPGRGRAPTRLPIALASAGQPAASPDGRLIAFSGVGTDGRLSLYLVHRDGSGLRRLTTGESDDNPTWSPDGTRLAFGRTHLGVHALWLINVDGTGARQLVGLSDGEVSIPGEYNEEPAWSPDGRRIAWARSFGGTHHIWVIDVDGANDRRLVATASDDREPAWTPDGQAITIRRTRNQESQIITIDARTGNELVTIYPPGEGSRPAWSPSGQWLAFASSGVPGLAVHSVAATSGSRVVVPVTAGTVDRVTWLRRP